MAKKAKSETLTKKQVAKSQKVRRRERNTLIGISTVIVLVVGVLIYGAIHEYLIRPNAPIATVDGVPISTTAYQKYWQYVRANTLASYEQYQSELNRLNALAEPTEMDTIFIQYYQQLVQQLESQLRSLDTSVLDGLIDDELVRQEAKKEGLIVTADEVQIEIETTFGYDRNPPTPMPTEVVTDTDPITETATPVPTATRMSESQFQSTYATQLDFVKKNFKFTEEEFRRLFETDLLRSKLGTLLGDRLPTAEEQVRVRHILVETEEEAKTVLDRLKAGEDFAALALEFSTDTSSKETGGDLGWFGRGMMVTEFEETAFSLEIGKISDPVQTSFGYHIIEVLERDANHPIDESTLSQRKSAALDEWLTTQRYSERVQRFFSSDKVPSPVTVTY